MNLEDALKKVEKLLRLAESDNPNEAANAAAQAQKILDKYEITRSMLEEHGEAEPDNEEVAIFRESPLHTATKFNLDKWRSRLAGIIAEHNMCEVMLVTGFEKKHIVIVGRPSDVEKVRYIFEWMLSETERLCKRDGKGQGRTWRNNYRHGVVDTIGRKFKRVRDDVIKELKGGATTSTALVKVDTALQKMDNKLAQARAAVDEQTKGKSDYDSRMTWQGIARLAGREAGEEIQVNNKARGALKS